MKFAEIQRSISELYAKPDASVGDYFAKEKLLQEIEDEVPAYIRRGRAAFLGSFTIQGLPEALKVRGVFDNILIDAYTAPYNQFTQEILNEASALYHFDPQIIYLVIDKKDILDEAHLNQLVSTLEARAKAKIILFNFTASPECPSEEIDIANQRLTREYRDHKKVVIFDFDAFLQGIGRKGHWYTKYKDLGDLRLAPSAFPALAEAMSGYAVAVIGATKKCAVLDLDNTLWQGIVGEDGMERIQPDQELQKHILDRYERGVILAIASRNNMEDAMEVINQHPRMILRKKHFAAWRINWDSKDRNIAALAEELNIGLDSMVFIDDDPFQQNLIRASLPEIAVVPPSRLKGYSGFHTFTVTEEDARRGALYAEDRLRKEFKQSFKDMDEYLRGLRLEVLVGEVGPDSIPRISQLTQKTNQFNLTTRRYSEEEITAGIHEGKKVWAVRVKDALGDYGTTGVCIVDPGSEEWRIDSFLLSCRVMGRAVEKAFLSYVANQARSAGMARLIGEYIPTKKNQPCASFFSDAGFVSVRAPHEVRRYHFDLAQELQKPDFITVREEE